MLDLPAYKDRCIATREVPARRARYAPLPEGLHPAIAAALADRKIERLYSHQAECYAAARAGENVVVTTGTASGKSLAFMLPLLQGMAEDPTARAFLLYPTKALSRDQLRTAQDIGGALTEASREIGVGGGGGVGASVGARTPAPRPIELGAGVYDGDTPPIERRHIRERCNLVLTNPDMLSAGLLPAHGRQGYSHLFRHVRWVVIDELHGYRGAFGAHVSNVIRRLLRVCAHYGSRPQFLCSSATIANPGELAEAICHRPFSVIDRDGSPSAGKTIHFWRPPEVAPDVRRGVGAEVAWLLPKLVRQRQKTIAFCRSRKQTEVVLKEVRDRLSRVARHHDESKLIAGYRGGYTPRERRKIERDLLSGELVAVVSTNALELGIDVGQLEVVMQAGFPGTRASFWQQLGRAGRRGRKAHGVLVLGQTPFDEYVARDPDWLVGQPAEHAVVDPDNLTIQLAHLRCAAAELPLTLDDAAIWPDLSEVIPVLTEAGELRPVYDGWHWCGTSFPAGDFSLRSFHRDRFKVVDRTSGRTLTEMTRPQVYREAHTRAIYLHDGLQYQVEELDLVQHVALVMPVAQNFYTQPDVRTHIEVLAAHELKLIEGAGDSGSEQAPQQALFGDVRVDEAIVGYKMMEFHNHQNLGYERLRQPLELSLETEAVWWPVPPRVLQRLACDDRDSLKGMAHAIRAVARMLTMAERSDLVGTSFRSPAEAPGAPVFEGVSQEAPGGGGSAEMQTSLVLYDTHPGGLGFAAKAWELADELLQRARKLVVECPCKQGCPSCVGDVVLDKALVGWGLTNLLEETPPPPLREPARFGADPFSGDDPALEHLEAQGVLPAGAASAGPVARMAWTELPEGWPTLRERLESSGRRGAALLATMTLRAVDERSLTFELPTRSLAGWLDERDHLETLRTRLEELVDGPAGWQLRTLAPAEDGAYAASRRSRDKLRHRLEDFRRDEPRSERAANARLASGFELREGRALPPEAEGVPSAGEGAPADELAADRLHDPHLPGRRRDLRRR